MVNFTETVYVVHGGHQCGKPVEVTEFESDLGEVGETWKSQGKCGKMLSLSCLHV